MSGRLTCQPTRPCDVPLAKVLARAQALLKVLELGLCIKEKRSNRLWSQNAVLILLISRVSVPLLR